jgi:flagellar basal body rod protein FlgG
MEEIGLVAARTGRFSRPWLAWPINQVATAVKFCCVYHFFQIGWNMLNGLYGTANALEALSKLQEATAANLAHLNTPGHRRMVAGFSQMVDRDNSETARPGSQVDRQSSDFTAGRMEHTGRNLDLAIQGSAFFMYQGEHGIMYSRNGVLFRDLETNELVNADGIRVLDDKRRPIVFTGDLSQLQVSPNGSLMSQGSSIGRLGIVSFDNNQSLESDNQTYFRIGKAEEQEPTDIKVVQGVRELSNANAVSELISLIVCSRHYEATQRALRSLSDSLQENSRSN